MSEPRPTYDCAIIGAGMSGLAAAVRLAMFGQRVVVLERHNAVGGLNSFYAKAGRRYDVGLHAMTNWVPEGTKGAPLTKLLRQLRIRREELDLSPQIGSRIVMGGRCLRMANDLALLEADVAREFPAQADGFRRVDADLRAIDENALDVAGGSARAFLAERITDPLLVDMLLLPTCYYGSAIEGDIDLPQFAIMWRALFREGFARPFAGVRQITRVLTERCRDLGVERRMRCGVRRIVVQGGRAAELELDDGSTLSATKVLSSAGLPETLRLCSDQPADAAADLVGRLAYAETIATYRQPDFDRFGWHDTIVFFCDSERFDYRAARELVDPRSGVICIPNNYAYAADQKLDEGWLRVTALANHDAWCALPEADYTAAKRDWLARLNRVARAHLPSVADADHDRVLLATDMFTPRTVRKYTGHLNGAIYGATRKRRDGRTHLDNLFLIGTDQGFLGITGAVLSGISMANLHVLSGELS
jgi:phytoene dehydrogenase-like protein